MKLKVRMGIIGAGRIGRLHAEHLVLRIPETEVIAISDINVKAAEECASRFNIPEATGDYAGILNNPEIDAVAVCSSTDTHAQIIEDSAAAGKHIFCEKPLALELKIIDRILTSVRRAGVKLQVGFNRRFDPNFKRIWELIREGRIGTPHILKITSRDPSPPPIGYVKVSGGIFLDMMIHDFDMARYLIGSEVDEVFSFGNVLVDPEIGKAGDIDTAVVSLKFLNGAMGVIDNSRKAVYGYDQRVEVFGSQGMAQTENCTPNRVSLATKDSVQEDLPLNFFVERYIESYINEMRTFVRCMAENSDPPVTGIDGRAAVVLGAAAQKSLKEKRPVRLKEIG
ncbi:MAG: inositol 2-dehydrogenase [Spirochaetota bacterium]